MINEVIADIDDGEIVLLIHWMGGTHTELCLPGGGVASATLPHPTSSMQSVS